MFFHLPLSKCLIFQECLHNLFCQWDLTKLTQKKELRKHNIYKVISKMKIYLMKNRFRDCSICELNVLLNIFEYQKVIYTLEFSYKIGCMSWDF